MPIEQIYTDMMISLKDNFFSGLNEIIVVIPVLFCIMFVIAILTNGKFFTKDKF